MADLLQNWASSALICMHLLANADSDRASLLLMNYLRDRMVRASFSMLRWTCGVNAPLQRAWAWGIRDCRQPTSASANAVSVYADSKYYRDQDGTAALHCLKNAQYISEA